MYFYVKSFCSFFRILKGVMTILRVFLTPPRKPFPALLFVLDPVSLIMLTCMSIWVFTGTWATY